MFIHYGYEPWPHSIIDDFFAEDILEEIEQTCEDIDFGLCKVYDSLRKRIEEEYFPVLRVTRDALLTQVPNALSPITTEDATFNVWVNKQQPHHAFKVHNDSPWKMLSTVVYIGEKGQGTLFHNDREDTEIRGATPWKHNRAFSFIPSTTSWHSYKNPFDTYRKTVLFNMGTLRDIKKAYTEIQGPPWHNNDKSKLITI